MIRFPAEAYEDLIWGRKTSFWCPADAEAPRWIASDERHTIYVGDQIIGTAKIQSLKTKHLADWKLDELERGAYSSHDQLKEVLTREYPDWKDSDPVTAVFFEIATLSLTLEVGERRDTAGQENQGVN